MRAASKSALAITRVATLDEVRAKDGNLSIPICVGPSEKKEAGTASAASGVEDALFSWIQSARAVRSSLAGLLSGASPKANAANRSKLTVVSNETIDRIK